MEFWSLAQGAGGIWTVPIVDDDEQPITSYSGSEPLTGKIWQGQDLAALVTLTPTWLSHAAGTTTVHVTKTSTATLATGQYRVQLKILDGVDDPVYFEGILKITASPGSGVVLPTYCTLDDMLDECSWLQDQSDIDHDETGFLKQRSNARKWLDRAILGAHRPQQAWGATTFGNSVFGNSMIRTPGINKLLKDYLDANLLMTGPPRPVALLTAKHAVGLVLKDCITSAGGGPKANPYAALSLQFLSEASDLLIGYVAEVDTNADGYPEYVIPCGCVDILRG